MRPLIVVNVEYIEATPFLVAILYGEDGHMIDALTQSYEGPAIAHVRIRLLAEEYRISTVEMWTSNNDLYVQSLTTAGIACSIKHPSDTAHTRTTIEQDREILTELYEIKPLIVKPKLPKWRAFFIPIMRKLLNHLEGNGRYEI